MADRDYYEVLGISRDATGDEIKRAYRRLAKQHHPDRNEGDAGAERKFKEVQGAYAVLSDVDKRAGYDRLGQGGMHAAAAGGPQVTWTTGGEPIDIEDLSDLFDFSHLGGQAASGGGPSGFEQFFRRGGRGAATRQPPPAGQDVEQDITLTFEQAVRGITLQLQVTAGATGARQTIEVAIPPGVRDGQRIRLRGKGQAGPRGGPPGNLYIVCSIKPHAFFERRDFDIYLEVPVTLDEAALGAKIDLPTLDGVRTVTIPPGTASGTKLRLTGLGIKKGKDGGRGDQYAVVKIVPPGKLTAEQKSLLERFAATKRGSPRDGLWT